MRIIFVLISYLVLSSNTFACECYAGKHSDIRLRPITYEGRKFLTIPDDEPIINLATYYESGTPFHPTEECGLAKICRWFLDFVNSDGAANEEKFLNKIADYLQHPKSHFFLQLISCKSEPSVPFESTSKLADIESKVVAYKIKYVKRYSSTNSDEKSGNRDEIKMLFVGEDWGNCFTSSLAEYKHTYDLQNHMISSSYDDKDLEYPSPETLLEHAHDVDTAIKKSHMVHRLIITVENGWSFFPGWNVPKIHHPHASFATAKSICIQVKKAENRVWRKRGR